MKLGGTLHPFGRAQLSDPVRNCSAPFNGRFTNPPHHVDCSVVPSVAGTTTSPSMIVDPALMCQASSAIFLNRLVQSLPRRV